MARTRTILPTTALAVLILASVADRRPPSLIAIDLSLAVTLLVSVPLALDLLVFQPSQIAASRLRDVLLRTHAFPAAAAVLALSFLSPGAVAIALGAGWIALTAGVALVGLFAATTFRGRWRLQERGADVACVYLVVGGAWLAATLLGVPFMGFHEPVVRLTAVHFHVASFCLVLVNVELARRTIDLDARLRRPTAAAVAVHIVSPAIVAAGITCSRGLEVIGTSSLVASWLAIATLAGAAGVLKTMSRASRRLLTVSFVCLATTLTLALSYSLSRTPLLTDMPLVHGLANAFVAVPCALLALRLSPWPLAQASDRDLLTDLQHVPVSTKTHRFLPLAHERVEHDFGEVSCEAFERAGAVLLAYSVYGERYMESLAPFRLEGRPPRLGDRIVQRLHLLLWGGHAVLTLPSLVEIDRVEDTPSVKALGYATTRFHVGVGQWRALLRRSDDGTCTVTVESWSRPRGIFLVTFPVFRVFQRRARDEAIRQLGEALRAPR